MPLTKDLTTLLDQIQVELPDAARTLDRLRRQRSAPLLKILLGTVLSQQTTNRQTRIALERLWHAYHTLPRLAKAAPSQLERLIRNVGLGRTKARRLVAIAADIQDRWGSERRLARYLQSAPLEGARQALLELPGVGPKTAAVILLFRFHRPTFPVDTNILRIARALGWIGNKGGPEDVRAFVETALPPNPKLLLKAHAYLIALGRTTQRGRRQDLIANLGGVHDRAKRRSGVSEIRRDPVR